MKLRKTTVWLLRYLAQRHPLGVTRTHSLPPDYEPGVGMATLNGLVKRGWAYEAQSNGQAIGIFYLSDKGRQVADTLK